MHLSKGNAMEKVLLTSLVVTVFCVVQLTGAENVEEERKITSGCVTYMPFTQIITKKVNVTEKIWRTFKTKCNGKACTRKRRVLVTKTKEKPYEVKVNKTMCCAGWVYKEIGSNASCNPVCQPDCPLGSSCVAPNKCLCQPPLIPITNTSNAESWLTECVLPPCDSGYRRSGNECEPICSSSCGHGSCSAPEICSCDEGYKNSADNITCVPRCPITCRNGHCDQPGVCVCDEGFQISDDGKMCLPICRNPCDNGRCVGPDLCECDPGYTMVNSSCVPRCSKECENGVCVSPEQCKCLSGYALSSDKYVCEAVCTRECVHGDCIGPDTCRCHDGYSADEQDFCRPICSKDCGEAGRCVAPEKCACFPGYASNGEEPCKPVCGNPCVHGVCTAPDTCTCEAGYRAIDQYTCEPVCSSCVHGKCVASDECVCHFGYAKVGSECTPECTGGCINARCTAPETCDCEIGYEFVEDSLSVCKKACVPACINGLCNENGTCDCSDGYIGDECGSIIRINCSSCMGTCFEESCRCPNGQLCEDDTVVVSAPQGVTAERQENSTMSLVWVYAAAGLLLCVAMLAAAQRCYRQRKTSSNSSLQCQDSFIMTTGAPGSLFRPDLCKEQEALAEDVEQKYDAEAGQSELDCLTSERDRQSLGSFGKDIDLRYVDEP